MSMVMTVGVIVFWCGRAPCRLNATISPNALGDSSRLNIMCSPPPPPRWGGAPLRTTWPLRLRSWSHADHVSSSP